MPKIDRLQLVVSHIVAKKFPLHTSSVNIIPRLDFSVFIFKNSFQGKHIRFVNDKFRFDLSTRTAFTTQAPNGVTDCQR